MLAAGTGFLPRQSIGAPQTASFFVEMLLY